MTIVIPIGRVVTLAIVVWILIGSTVAMRRKRRLEKLRAKQEAVRLRALETELRPPLMSRLRLPWRRRQ